MIPSRKKKKKKKGRLCEKPAQACAKPHDRMPPPPKGVVVCHWTAANTFNPATTWASKKQHACAICLENTVYARGGPRCDGNQMQRASCGSHLHTTIRLLPSFEGDPGKAGVRVVSFVVSSALPRRLLLRLVPSEAVSSPLPDGVGGPPPPPAGVGAGRLVACGFSTLTLALSPQSLHGRSGTLSPCGAVVFQHPPV